MKNLFDVASGSVIGRDHVKPLGWRNSQDAHLSRSAHGCLIGVVSDGCGSAPHSEVGSKLIVQIVCNAIASYLPRYLARTQISQSPIDIENSFSYWEDVQSDLIAHLRVLAKSFGIDVSDVAEEYFLASLVGFVITPFTTFIFSVGDGYYVVNNEIVQLLPAAGNMPAYPGYHLLRKDRLKISRDDCHIKVQLAVPTETVQSIFVGTDGVQELIAAEEKLLPGKTNVVGPLSQFWTEDQFFSNPFGINRRLALVNNEVVIPDWETRRLKRFPGHLKDDTTFVVARRKPQP